MVFGRGQTRNFKYFQDLVSGIRPSLILEYLHVMPPRSWRVRRYLHAGFRLAGDLPEARGVSPPLSKIGTVWLMCERADRLWHRWMCSAAFSPERWGHRSLLPDSDFLLRFLSARLWSCLLSSFCSRRFSLIGPSLLLSVGLINTIFKKVTEPPSTSCCKCHVSVLKHNRQSACKYDLKAKYVYLNMCSQICTFLCTSLRPHDLLCCLFI